ICWALGDLRGLGVAAIPELIGATSHPDWQVREYALRALGKVAEKVDSTNADERNVVAQALGGAFDDPVGQVRKSAVWAAGALQTTELLPELIASLDDPYYGARMNASEALVKFNTKALDGLLIFLAHCSDSSVAGDIICKTLGEIEIQTNDTLSERRQNELAGQLLSPSAYRRLASVQALGICGDYRIVIELENLRLTERDPFVSSSLEQALALIAERERTSVEDTTTAVDTVDAR
ncbi:HEAT repeat domain-containing protein, partial [Gemmatimonas aurantiaca]|nr:HEAT repeat domain-containing protein [Gemmatimonas aurantiaca]